MKKTKIVVAPPAHMNYPTASMAPLPRDYKPGMLITSFQGLMMYHGNKFFFRYKLVDWEYIEGLTFGTLILAIKGRSLHLARAISREQQIMDSNIRHARRAEMP